MTTPFYDPPYDSPIEDLLAYHIVKHLAPDVEWLRQFHVDTRCGHFIVDFVAITPAGRRIGLECDGKAFHDEFRDEFRDAMILGDNTLDVIYRLRGRDINLFVESVLYLLSRHEPDLFSERGRLNLRSLCNENVRDRPFDPLRNFASIGWRDEETGAEQHLVFDRRNRIVPAGRREHWQALYAYAVEHGAADLDVVIADRRRWHLTP